MQARDAADDSRNVTVRYARSFWASRDARSTSRRQGAVTPRPDSARRLGGSLEHDGPALFATFGSEIDDPVGALDHVEVVLDHEQRGPTFEKPVEAVHELAHVPEMEARGRLVEDVEHARTRLAEEMRGQLHPLGFSPGEGGRGLAEAQVAEADLLEDLEAPGDPRLPPEEMQRLVHGQVQDLVDRLPVVAHLEQGRRIAPAPADLADEIHVGEELQVHPHLPVPRAGLAASAGDVEREVAGREPQPPRVLGGREDVADGVEGLDIGDGVGAGAAADGRLVDDLDLVHELGPLQDRPGGRRPHRCDGAAARRR